MVSRPGRGGYTLVEVLVSVTILALGVVAAMTAFDACLSSLASSGDLIRASMLMKEKITTFEQGSGASEALSSGSEAGFAWRIEVHPARRPSGAAVDEVVVSTWPAGKEKAAYSLTTYFVERPPR